MCLSCVRLTVLLLCITCATYMYIYIRMYEYTRTCTHVFNKGGAALKSMCANKWYHAALKPQNMFVPNLHPIASFKAACQHRNIVCANELVCKKSPVNLFSLLSARLHHARLLVICAIPGAPCTPCTLNDGCFVQPSC